MMKHIFSTLVMIAGLALIGSAVAATLTEVPAPFRGFDSTSTYQINYSQLNAMLKMAVVDTGRSTREVADPTRAATGTRMKANVQRSTTNEGNRFYFEMFNGDDEAEQVLRDIRDNLAALPSQAPLQFFNRNEQLAYWLNLYNFTLLNEVVKVYPKRKLNKLLKGKKSILDQKLITVAGVSLSLNDIQHVILKQNYENNPLVMYGLYQGIIGGPNIRKSAYTGVNVQRNLADNAAEFINSNRGTYAQDEKIFRASSLYDRNRGYFPDFQSDLKKHLMAFLQGPEKRKLEFASTIKPDIDDWTVTDLYGSYPQIGGSFAQNKAALLDATKSTTTGEGGVAAAPSVNASSRLFSQASTTSYVSPELIIQLQELKAKQDATNLDKATVTVEELGEVPVETGVEAEPGSVDEENN
ncbi:DUF547 domain-containing protein [Pseudomonadota bacterium]